MSKLLKKKQVTNNLFSSTNIYYNDLKTKDTDIISDMYGNVDDKDFDESINVPFDIIYVCHEKDRHTLLYSILSVKKYMQGYGNIYLISKYNYKSLSKEIIWISEGIFEFNKNDVKDITGCHANKVGWIFQQLIKLYAHEYIKELKDNYLLLDADVIFLNNITMFSDNKPYLTLGYNINQQYFEHISKLLPNLVKQTLYSGIVHHMLININIIKQLILDIEAEHNDKMWKAFLKCIDASDYNNINYCSEYELYFNYVLKNYRDFYNVRMLAWDDVSLSFVQKCNELDYIACHTYLS